jgi:putative hemolysin
MDDGSRWPHAFASITDTLASAFFRWHSGDWGLLLILLLSLVLAGVASAAETALTSVNRIKLRNLEDEGDAKARRILRLIDQPHIFLTTILATNNIAIILATTVATLLSLNVFATGAEVISTIGLSLIVLVACEIMPKTAAVQSPERWARVLVGPVEMVTFVLKPLILGITWLTNNLLRLVGIPTNRRGPYLTEEELRLLVEPGSEEEVTLEEEKRDMIHNVFELGDKMVREVMVPRIDMVTISADASLETAMDLIVHGGQSRIPIYETSTENIIGLLYAKDLLGVQARHEHLTTIKSLARPAYFVPETKRLDDLLRELRSRRIHLAIVVDEYGSVSGLVTIEDLVEEIVGEIVDEYDIVEEIFQQLGSNVYLVDGKISLDDLNDLLGAELTSEDYDTLGGYVYEQLDKIPSMGDTVSAQGFTFTVVGIKDRRVTKVKIVRGMLAVTEQQSAQESVAAAEHATAESTTAAYSDDTQPAAETAQPAPEGEVAGDTPQSNGHSDQHHDAAAKALPEPPPPLGVLPPPEQDTGDIERADGGGASGGRTVADSSGAWGARTRLSRRQAHRAHGRGISQQHR